VKGRERDPANLVVRTLCRNTSDHSAETEHEIQQNTAFEALVHRSKLRCFFGNNLPRMSKRGRYRNTTPDWPDRYQATVVWPIRSTNAPAGWDLLAYLCVDCRSTNVFDEERDYPIGAMVSCSLHAPIAQILDNPEPLD